MAVSIAGEEAILVCPWQFQQLLRPDPGAVTKEERMGTLIFPEQVQVVGR